MCIRDRFFCDDESVFIEHMHNIKRVVERAMMQGIVVDALFDASWSGFSNAFQIAVDIPSKVLADAKLFYKGAIQHYCNDPSLKQPTAEAVNEIWYRTGGSYIANLGIKAKESSYDSDEFGKEWEQLLMRFGSDLGAESVKYARAYLRDMISGVFPAKRPESDNPLSVDPSADTSPFVAASTGPGVFSAFKTTRGQGVNLL